MTKEELTLLELTSRMEFWKATCLRLMEDLAVLSPVEAKNELDAAPISGKEWERGGKNEDYVPEHSPFYQHCNFRPV